MVIVHGIAETAGVLLRCSQQNSYKKRLMLMVDGQHSIQQESNRGITA